MRVINKKIVITILVILEICSIYLMYKSYNNKNLLEDKIEEPKKEKLAIKVDNGNGEYVYSTDLPGKGYTLNKELTECIDIEGNKVNNPKITSDGDSVTITSKYTNYCTLYFDEKTNISSICKDTTMQDCISDNDKLKKINTIENLTKEIVSDLYRYHGSSEQVINNYICFGTDNKEKCTNDQEHYMYRIVGITNDGKLKLVKNTAMEKKVWNDKVTIADCGDNGENCTWEKSSLKKYLNEEFIANKSYIADGWLDKIEDMNWNIGAVVSTDATDAQNIFIKESSKQTAEKLKIGLISLSDHYYAYDELGKQNCDTNYCNSWIFYPHEWFLTPYGIYDNTYYVWLTWSKEAGNNLLNNERIAPRPSFYLKNNNKLKGNGLINNPYIINE